jgi:hypothetical protein
MCNSCGGKTYGQDQPESRQADKEKLIKSRKAMEVKSLTQLTSKVK